MAVMRQNRALVLGALAAALLLGLLTPAERVKGEKQEHLSIQVTEQFTGNITTKGGQSEIHTTITATARDTGPAGTQPWGMSTVATDWTCSVQGGGKITERSEDGTEVTTTVTYKPKIRPKNSPPAYGLAQIGEGTYTITESIDDLCAADMDTQVTGSQPLANAIAGPLAAVVLSPSIFVTAWTTVPIFTDQQLSGTFDPKSKSFTRSGNASASSSREFPDQGATVSATLNLDYTIGFNEEPEEVEAILIPDKNYANWRPTAADDEDTPGNGILVQVVLQKKDQQGQKPRTKAKSFKFELLGVSKEPGVCLNWPPKDRAKTTADLKIDKVANPDLQVADDGQSATSGPDLQESQVIIFSYDWGGWGSMRVSADLDNGDHVVAHLDKQPAVQELKIPKDDNNNHIADVWEQGLTGSLNATSDDDDQPKGDKDTGDGLSLYEEYRGFRISGQHHVTDPRIKDLFVHDFDHLGLGYFRASGLKVNLVDYNEFAAVPSADRNPWVINFNTSGFAHLGDVHVLFLMDHPVDGGLGEAVGGPGVPKEILAVWVDRQACLGSKYGQLEVDNTVAHELAHCCNVLHHGDKNYPSGEVWQRGPTKWYSIGDGDWLVAAPQGEHSGVQNCIMRKYRADFYEYAQGTFRWRNSKGEWTYGLPYPPTQVPGTIFCHSPLGTGINDPHNEPAPVAGDADAGRGNCTGQFCVNDLKH